MKKKIKKIKKKIKINKIKEKLITKLYFGICGILVIVLIGLILLNMGIFEKENEVSKFNIDDECAVIMGNLIHNIRDDGDCKIKCTNNCEILELDFFDSKFMIGNASCNACDCFCQ